MDSNLSTKTENDTCPQAPQGTFLPTTAPGANPNSALTIEYWALSRFVPYYRGLRKNDRAVERMIAAIREFGFKIPILARSSGEVVDGHLRLKAAQKLGMTEVPVILCDDWSEAQVRAFRLLVNRSATWADWDTNLVALELADLKALDFDLKFTGFDPVEIDAILFRKQDEPDEVVPEPAEPVTRVADLWMCGSHRVLCGDATSARDVALLLGEASPTIMITDPPYGVEYDPDWRVAYQLFPGDVAYVWHAGAHAAEVAQGLEAVGFRIRAQIIWAKQHFALGRGDYHYQHEPCWYAVREGKASNWCGDRTQSTLWQVPNLNPFGGSPEDATTGHGTQKPAELMRRPILNHTQRGDLVYDPFLGSGTTMIAAEKTERTCYGLEIDAHYVDVIVKRWQRLTGQQAVLQLDNRRFSEVAAERNPVGVEA